MSTYKKLNHSVRTVGATFLSLSLISCAHGIKLAPEKYALPTTCRGHPDPKAITCKYADGSETFAYDGKIVSFKNREGGNLRSYTTTTLWEPEPNPRMWDGVSVISYKDNRAKRAEKKHQSAVELLAKGRAVAEKN